jgi:ubiquinone/menaquinone biosynthesis C-methylase UbiE
VEDKMETNIYKFEGKKIDGIFTFINQNELEGDNLKFSKLYNKISPFYYFSQKIFSKIKFGGEYNFRNDFLQYIKVNDNDLVLETSIGTADNLYHMNKNAKYYGADISMGMLKMALKHTKKWSINAELNCCEAENLPYKDNVFDVVYSCGGFNFYNDKQKAVNEMIRVSKSGKKIFIIDETEKTVKEIYKNVPGNKLYDKEKANVPIEFIPKEMKDIEWKIVCKGYMYILSFIKP